MEHQHSEILQHKAHLVLNMLDIAGYMQLVECLQPLQFVMITLYGRGAPQLMEN